MLEIRVLLPPGKEWVIAGRSLVLLSDVIGNTHDCLHTQWLLMGLMEACELGCMLVYTHPLVALVVGFGLLIMLVYIIIRYQSKGR